MSAPSTKDSTDSKLTYWQHLYATVNGYVMVDDASHSVEVNRRDLSVHGNVHLEEHHLPWGSAWRDSDECFLYRVIHSLDEELPSDDDVWYIAVIPQSVKKNNAYYTIRLFSRYPDTCKHCGQYMLQLLYPMNKALSIYKECCSRQCAESHKKLVSIVMEGSVYEQTRITQFKERVRNDCLALDGLLKEGSLFANPPQHMPSYGSNYGLGYGVNYGQGYTSPMVGVVNVLRPVSFMPTSSSYSSCVDNERFLITYCFNIVDLLILFCGCV